MARKRSAAKGGSNRPYRRSVQDGTTAPTKNTSGSGFGFETLVVAASLLDMLIEQPLHRVALSRLTTVSVQKGPAMWCCDDLLLTYVTKGEEQLLIPTSIKSFPALSKSSKRDEFVTHAWSDALGEKRLPRPLRLGHDRIGLFSSRHSLKLADTLSELIKKAREQGADFRHNVTAPGHLAGGGKWLSHLSCPTQIAVGISDAVQQSLISSLELREFDFASSTSQSYQQAVNDSRLATVSESHEDGRLLWQELCGVAEDLRDAGGDITRRRLIDKLVAAPKLKDSPRFADTWRRLAGESDRELARQPRTIGRTVTLERQNTIVRLENLAKNSAGRGLVVCGPSGSGKSAAASLLCNEVTKRSRALWLSLPLALTLTEQSAAGILGHGDSIVDVLHSVASPDAWLFVDGVDRATRQVQFEALAVLLRSVNTQQATPWRIVVTCQEEHWLRVRRSLLMAGVRVDQWEVTEIEPLVREEITQVTRQVPAILPVVSQPRLRAFACRPLILDLLVKAAEDGDLPDREWVGESYLVDWFWDTRVRARVDIAGSQYLMELGRRQADLGELDTAVSEMPSDQVVEPLLAAGLLRERQGRITFEHDTIADWARLRWILTQGPKLFKTIEQRSSNPLWHSALRLLAIDRLEQFPTTDRWEELVDECESAIDFALDGLIFAADSQTLLHRIADRLFADEAKLAKRLIRRAVVVCTAANRMVLERAAAEIAAPAPFPRTVSRDPRPFHFFWGTLLQFLGTETMRLAEAAPKEAAELATIWLRMTPADWPHRDVAAEIALTIAEQTLADRNEYRRSIGDEDARIIFQSSLAALREKPSRAKQFYLQACALEPVRSSTNSVSRTRNRKRLKTVQTEGIPVDSIRWPGGPIAEVDTAFRDACFRGDGMECLFANDPKLAEQMLLALMIDVRHPDDVEDRYSSVYDTAYCGLISPVPGLSAPHYRQGPFLNFLCIAPREAMSLILKIVNFATERAVAAIRRRRPSDVWCLPSPTGNSEVWNGNELVFAWNRARLDACARAVAPLTALEKWLADRVADGEDIGEELGVLLAGARSVAIAGMLIDLGRRHPQLFHGPLRSLLQSPLILIWGEMQTNHSDWMPMGVPETRLGECFFDEHKAWLFAKFRKRSILDDVERLAAAGAVRWEELQTTPFAPTTALSPEQGLQLIRQCGAHGQHLWMATPNEQGPENAARPLKPSRPTPSESAIAVAQAYYRALTRDLCLEESALATLRGELDDLKVEVTATTPELQFQKRHVRLGQVTFLVVQHADWLRQQGLWAEYLAYAIRETSDLAFAFWSAGADTLREFDWQSFLVPLAMDLWAAEVDNPRLQCWVAHLAVFATGRAKRKLITLGFERRKELGDRQLSLIHLLLRSSAAWWEIEFRQENREDEFDIAAWWAAELRNFLSGCVPPVIPALESLYLREPPIRYAHWRSDHRNGPDDDIFFRYTPLNNHNILAVVHGMPLAATASSNREAQERVAIVRLALEAELGQLVAYDQEGHPLDIPCHEHPTMIGQREVIERIAAELIECRDPATIGPLWQTVIGLGVAAPLWVEILVSKWLWPSLALPEFPPHTEKAWQAVIGFAADHANWRETSSASRTDADELWTKLLGVDESCFSMWRVDHTAVIERAAPLIGGKIAELSASPRTAGPVVRWISRGPGRRFIPVALRSIADNLNRFKLDRTGDEQLANCLAEFLDVAWETHTHRPSSEPFQRGAFCAVLRRVASAGNPLAIDLEQRVSGSA